MTTLEHNGLRAMAATRAFHVLRRRYLHVALSCACLVLTGCERNAARTASVTRRGDTLIVTGPPKCALCRIRLDSLTTLGTSTDAISPSPSALVARMGDGRFFVSSLIGAIGVAEYDSSGRLVSVHGSKGSGPGEYQMAPFGIARAPGDTLVVYDHPSRRFSFLAPNGSYVDSFESPVRVSDFTALADGSLLVGGAHDRGDPFELGPSAHIFSRHGRLMRPVGDSVGPVRPDKPLARSRTVAAGRSGLLAVAKRLDYEILLVRPDGARLIIKRTAPWFTPIDTSFVRRPQLTKIWIDDGDRLWVSILTRNPKATREEIYSTDEGKAYGTIRFVVDVFDSSTGELLVSQTFDDAVVVDAGLATAPAFDSTGNIALRVWIPTLTLSGR